MRNNSVICVKIMFMRVFPVLLALLFAACGESPSAGNSKFSKPAESFCQCTQTLLALNKAAESNPSAVDFQQLQQEFEKAKNCVSNVFTRFGKPAEADIPAMEAAVKEKCPDWAQKEAFLSEFFGQ